MVLLPCLGGKLFLMSEVPLQAVTASAGPVVGGVGGQGGVMDG